MNFIKASSRLLLLILILFGCSSQKIKLDPVANKSGERIIFGKFTDTNPDSRDLSFTYTLDEVSKGGLFSFDNSFPNIDPETGYFWISVPKDTKYFGIRSISFGIKGRTGSASVRDEKTNKSIFGSSVKSGESAIYVGDIFITSGMTQVGKSLVGIPVEQFDIKDSKVSSNLNGAKKFLSNRGFQERKISEVILKPVQ